MGWQHDKPPLNALYHNDFRVCDLRFFFSLLSFVKDLLSDASIHFYSFYYLLFKKTTFNLFP